MIEKQIREKIGSLFIPGFSRSLDRLNLVRNIDVLDGKVSISMAALGPQEEIKGLLESMVKDAIKDIPGIKDVKMSFVNVKSKDVNNIGKVVAVMSGKGGVGKSLLTGLLGFSLTKLGFAVGILDADITGPSIPKMFGIKTRPFGSDTGIIPALSRAGIEIMSINLLLEHEDDAIIWRGPLVGNAIKQFWEEVVWGKLDYLLVDLPPGTSDAPLTVMQSLPLHGVVIVLSPQELAAMVVRKAVKMAQVSFHIPIIGVVENMSYFLLPETGKKIEIFGKSKALEMAKTANAPLLGQIPIDPELAKLCDEGNIEKYSSNIVDSVAEAFLKAIVVRGKEG